MKKLAIILALTLVVGGLTGCMETSTDTEKNYTENIKKQSLSSVGLPDVSNFFEVSQLKEIYELRDDPDMMCYWYIMNEYTGKWIYQGKCVGYGIPYSTQITNPTKKITNYDSTIDQAEPNGLYSTGSSTATWILSVNKKGKIKPRYVEQEIYVTPEKVDKTLCQE